MAENKELFAGKHLIADIQTINKRNLCSEKNIKGFLESLSKTLKMTIVSKPLIYNFSKLKNAPQNSGISGTAIWAESHATIHTWPENNYFSFDAFSCKKFETNDCIQCLVKNFDIEKIFICDTVRYKNTNVKLTRFEINKEMEVIMGSKNIGRLNEINLNSLEDILNY